MRANKGKKYNCVATECNARKCIVSVKGSTKIEIVMKEQQNQYNFKTWKRIESGLTALPRGDKLCMDRQKHPIVARTGLFQTSKGFGLDLISSCFLKIGMPILARPLSQLFNLSMSQGLFPDSWKIARVAPIHKTGPKHTAQILTGC